MNQTRILMVDDQSNWTRLVRLMLERTGPYQVKEENRPEKALAAARVFRPDLILLDVDMPVMNGGELLRALRRDSVVGQTPVLFLSGLVTREQREINGTPVLPKPFDTVALRAAIQSATQAPLAPPMTRSQKGLPPMPRVGIVAAAA